MNKKIIFKTFQKYSYFIWLVFLIFFTVLVTYFYSTNKKNQIDSLNKALGNIYLNKVLKKITSELKPRYINIEYNVKQGDTYESIIKNLNIPNTEKKKFLNTVTKDKNINVLKLNQKIFFKIDKKNNAKIINFINVNKVNPIYIIVKKLFKSKKKYYYSFNDKGYAVAISFSVNELGNLKRDLFEKFLEKEKLFINLTKTDKFFIKKHKEIVSEKNDIFMSLYKKMLTE